MRKWMVNLLIVVAVVVLFGVAFLLGSQHATDGEEGFVGTDSAATEHIEESNPDYEPWFSPLFEPGSGEIESGLFALQAAIGAGVLGFVLGALWQRRKTTATDTAIPSGVSPAEVDLERDADQPNTATDRSSERS